MNSLSLLRLLCVTVTLLVSSCGSSKSGPPTVVKDLGGSNHVVDLRHEPVVDLTMESVVDLAQPIVEDFAMQQMCVVSCQVDTDCQNSCPNVMGGMNCCDVNTNTCYVAQDMACPSPPPGMADLSSSDGPY